MTEAVDQVLRGQRAAWRVHTPLPAEVRASLNGISVMVAHLLYCRGYRTPEAIEAFFTQGTVSHDPFSLPDMEPALARITRAVRDGERVAVYGDFDCDGITSAAVLAETLRGLGLAPIVHIPDRVDGHGLHPEGLARLADAGVTLIITADCGITAINEVQVARGMGMDVVVTDHHEPRPDGSLPDCPTISPTRLDAEYPCRVLCGVGVAYKLAQALAATLPNAPDPSAMLDLVALGTVADVVPLRDENRSLVLAGLRRLRRTERPGLLALFEASSVDPRRIDPTSVGFYLAPRLNAANRMASPQLAYDLITASDPERAASLASSLSRHNENRQTLVTETFARLALDLGDPGLIADDVASGRRSPLLLIVGNWPAGISGLIASKLVDAYGLPAFVGSRSPDGVVAVSARGVPGVHVDELLEAAEAALPEGLFLGYGGHSRAGGFRVEGDRLDLAQELLEAEARRRVPAQSLGATLEIDATVSVSQLTLEAARQIEKLAPFGMEFPEPLFLAQRVTLGNLRPLKGGRHLRCSVRQGTGLRAAVFFNAPPELGALPADAPVDVVFHLQLNEWQGTVTPQLQLRDWRRSN